MMSASTRRFSMKIYTYCQFCILLVCVQQIQSESGSVSREGLREEHLLPVRMTRAVDEGSGDDAGTPIHVLQSKVMERMMLKPDEAAEEENKILESGEVADDGKSKESIEATVEGSGFGDLDLKSEIIAEKEAVNGTASEESDSEESDEIVETTTAKEEVITTVKEEEITTAVPKVDVTEINFETTTIAKEEEEDEEESTTLPETMTIVTTEATTEKIDVTILPPVAVTAVEQTTLPEIITEIKVGETQTTTLKAETTTVPTTTTEEPTTPVLIVGRGEDATETPKPEREPITELIEVKIVQPAGVELPTKIPDEVKTDAATTATSLDDTLLENVNLTAGTGTLLMKSDSRFLDTNEKVLESSKDPSRLGTYIVISLILLSFLSLIGFILMKRRVQKRRKKSNMDPETLDTEKALLSLSEYKDHPDGVDEGKIKNNEITPIVIKSNSQINKFEKNTNFSSPKNLNTKANEKNVEKENVLRKTSDNLTQVIIEDANKDVEEEKAQTNAEKLIVRTHLDQDSIPKKPVLVNRTSLGCVPVSQD